MPEQSKKIKREYIFLVEIEIHEDQWYVLSNNEPAYKKSGRIIIPVKSSTAYHATEKFKNKCCGSEYPNYSIISVNKADYFLFSPMI